MNKGRYIVGIISLLLLFVSCTTENSGNPDIVRVIVPQDERYVCTQNVIRSEFGENVFIRFTLEEGYAFASCNYGGNYSFFQEGEETVLCLENVRFDTRLSFRLQEISGQILYYLNGGTFLDPARSGDYYTEYADTTYQLRPNTSRGTEVIERDGYTLIGWNRESDGSGEHIGLGSRVTVIENASVTLYAEWKEWSDVSLFSYQDNEATEEEGDITLIQYLGDHQDVDTLTIPAQIDGKKVTAIGENFSSNLAIDTLIFPETLRVVENKAFRGSDIENLYFFDTITQIGDRCFGNAISFVHINAATEPKYVHVNETAQFSESMDRLIINADKRKMVFFAGCSMGYGLNSEEVERAFQGEYVICDIGVIGCSNSSFQMECLMNFLREGDIFIHAPETMSAYQLMYDLSAEWRMFICVEGNYDLLAMADLSDTGGLFNAFYHFNLTRQTMDPVNPDDFYHAYNEYGDYVAPRPNSENDAVFEEGTAFRTDYLTETSLSKLNGYYTKIKNKGVKVLFSYGPVNANAIRAEEREAKSWLLYEGIVKNRLTAAEVISDPTDYIMEGRFFYDTDYHLSNEGAKFRTQTLIQDIKTHLQNH